MDYVLLILLGLAWAIGTPIVALIALARTSSLRDQNVRLAAELAQVRREFAAGTATPPLPPPFVEPLPEPQQETLAEPVGEAPAPVEAVPPTAPPLPPPFAPAPAAPAEKASLEQRLGARAFIWVGAITLALAAVFLVRYSIEEGYLSPEVRVVLAALFGFGLIAGAEKLRSRDDWVAQAMAAAGVAALYGALFSAVALYGMISQAAAGGGAAALTAFAIGVSLRHGIFVAALAFVGGFASPAIIGSDAPNVPVLFGYLLAIAVGTMAVIRHRGWWILGWGVLAGSAAWTVVWMLSATSGLLWVGLFLVAVAALFAWATSRRLAESAKPFAEAAEVTSLVWTALAGSGVLLAVMVVFDSGRQDAGWLCLGLHGLGLYVLGRRMPHFQYLAGLAPLLSLATLACWWFLASNGGWAANLDRFAWLSVIFGGGYAAGAFALMWNAGRPGFWAALSVAAALTHFLWCWFVLRDVTTGTPWGLISIGLAAPFLVGAERLVRWRERMPGATEALGYLAAGVSFFIAVAIALELSREWITVAYAVELAAVAAIARTLGLLAMRRLCWGLLAVVAVRFVFNPEVLQYPLGVTPVFNWILWGYAHLHRGAGGGCALPARRALDDPVSPGDPESTCRAVGLQCWSRARGAQPLPAGRDGTCADVELPRNGPLRCRRLGRILPCVALWRTRQSRSRSGDPLACGSRAVSRWVLRCWRSARSEEDFPEVGLLAGNVATYEGALALIDAGVDAIKVGIRSRLHLHHAHGHRRRHAADLCHRRSLSRRP